MASLRDSKMENPDYIPGPPNPQILRKDKISKITEPLVPYSLVFQTGMNAPTQGIINIVFRKPVCLQLNRVNEIGALVTSNPSLLLGHGIPFLVHPTLSSNPVLPC